MQLVEVAINPLQYLQLVFFCINLSLHAVLYVANLITSKFCVPEMKK